MVHDPDPRGLDFDPLGGHANRHRWTRRRRLMAPHGAIRWMPERRDEVEAAIRGSRTRAEAGAKLGTTAEGVSHAAKVYGFPLGAILGRPARVAEPPEPEPAAPVPVDWTGARPASTSTGFERRLVLGDLHVPFHHLRACGAAISLARALQPHAILVLGDLFNMGAVSHHPPPVGGRENHSRAMVMGRAFLESLRRSAPGADLVVLLGNHDTWADEYEDAHPEMAGMFAPSWLTEIASVVTRRAQPYVRGPVAYLHGYGGGEMAAKKYALEVGPHAGVRYVKAAHHHTVQCHCARNGCEAWIVGWLGRAELPAFDYAKNRDHWRLAACVEDVVGERVTTTPVGLDNGSALFGGRMVAA